MIPLRLASLQTLVLGGAFLIVTTQVLSLFTAISRTAIAAAWLIAAACATWMATRLPRRPWPRLDPGAALAAAAIAGMTAIIAYTAVLSPPNSADAMSYHLPRVLMWAQQRSTAFFPTSYLNQIMLQPMAEYAMLHLYLLDGSDRFVNLVQCVAYLGAILAVSAIAAELGLSPRAQAVAAIFCATLPNAVLQASGAKNDVVLALWLACTMLFALRWARTNAWADLAFFALAASLSPATKGTAYLFLPPVVAAATIIGRPRRWRTGAAALAAATLLLNGPHYGRNIELSGSPLGFDSAHADGVFRWRNEALGWKSTLSNALRNLSEQAGARSPRWNQAVFAAVVRIHARFGLDPDDPGSTWRGARFAPPRNTNHEADANNRWHLLILLIAVPGAAIARNRQWLCYAIAPIAGAFAFCFYLKWQPFLARLELPLFVLGAPLAAWAIGRLRYAAPQIAICVLLLANTRLALLQNWTRPLTGPAALDRVPRQMAYFNDTTQFAARDLYLQAVAHTAASECALVGLDVSQYHVLYPFQALLRERNPAVQFLYVGVDNPSARYARPGEPAPCAILCPDCGGDPGRIERYSQGRRPHTIGRFLLFLQEDPPRREEPTARNQDLTVLPSPSVVTER